MSVMTTLHGAVPRGRALTIADLDATPDDGNRYELIDGVLVVSAAPMLPHSLATEGLADVLRAARPDGWRVMTTIVGVALTEDTMMEPDITVYAPISAEQIRSERYLTTRPQLVVEVLSPSTALNDLNVKFARFEQAGIASYWVVDPDALRLIAWELVDGKYIEVADVTDGSWNATKPFDVTVTPSALLD